MLLYFDQINVALKSIIDWTNLMGKMWENI